MIVEGDPLDLLQVILLAGNHYTAHRVSRADTKHRERPRHPECVDIRSRHQPASTSPVRSISAQREGALWVNSSTVFCLEP